MSLLDTKIFGLINSIADGVNTYTARQKLRFIGTVTVSDDPATNTTTIDVSGGGGGGGTPSNVTPEGIEPTGSAGIASAYSRGDHTHALTPANLQAITSSASASWDFNGNELRFLGAPTLPGSAARKQDVDASPIHPPVRALDLGYGIPFTGLVTVAGVTMDANDRYGRAGDGVDNGIWIAKVGAHTRATDWPAGRIINGDCFVVLEGDAYPGEMIAHFGAPVSVGMGAPNLDTVNRPETLYGDTTGLSYTNRVVKIEGDTMSQQLALRARTVRHCDAAAATLRQLYQKTANTSSTTPTTAETHDFQTSAGCATALVQVNFINSAGVAESFNLKETRSWDSVATPVLVGTLKSAPEPASPTASVAIAWGLTSVSVVVTAPDALGARWGVVFEVFESSHP